MSRSSFSQLRDDDSAASLFRDDVDLLNAEEWLLIADFTANREERLFGEARNRYKRVKELLVHLLPEVKDLRISSSTETMLVPLYVEAQIAYGWVPMQNLSLGYRTLIAWMVDFASRLFDRYPNSENPLVEPAIVLVDEIDLHLHPSWQRKLMDYLSDLFPNTQFIATAHSPLIVQAATNANIAVLRREGDHVIIDNDVEAVKNWRIDQVLTSDLFGLESARPPQLDKALAERTEILSKPELTDADQHRLHELEAEIGELPTGETQEDIEAMDLIRRAAALLKDE